MTHKKRVSPSFYSRSGCRGATRRYSDCILAIWEGSQLIVHRLCLHLSQHCLYIVRTVAPQGHGRNPMISCMAVLFTCAWLQRVRAICLIFTIVISTITGSHPTLHTAVHIHPSIHQSIVRSSVYKQGCLATWPCSWHAPACCTSPFTNPMPLYVP